MNQKLKDIAGMPLQEIADEFISVAELQRRILPAPEPLAGFGEFDIFGRTIPTSVVGGDFYDFFDLQIYGIRGRIGVVIADAAGHGLAAAMLIRDFSTALRTAISFQAYYVQDTTPLLFRKINRRMYRSSQSNQFISAFYGELRLGGLLHYINAGHYSPLLFQKDGVARLNVGGPVLGAFLELPFEYQVGEVQMQKGDILLCYTDGVTETKRADGTEYGVERLEDVVRSVSSKSAQEIFDYIMRDVESYSGFEKQTDDRTVIVIKKSY
ncbi:MAG: serine/threonine-protein phosphatase [Acidobacteria bacterium]|nr:serine/threonine-protein phosphatase [Acidobacteriota bacterium]